MHLKKYNFWTSHREKSLFNSVLNGHLVLVVTAIDLNPLGDKGSRTKKCLVQHSHPFLKYSIINCITLIYFHETRYTLNQKGRLYSANWLIRKYKLLYIGR